MYEEYKEYVKNYLLNTNCDISPNKNQQFRSRYLHSLRVLEFDLGI